MEYADIFYSRSYSNVVNISILQLSETSGTSLGYGFSRIMMKSKNQPDDGHFNHGIDGGVNDWRPEGSVLP